MRRRVLLSSLLLAGACATGRAVTARAPRAAPPAAPPLLQLPEDVRPLSYSLELEVDPGRPEGFVGRGDIDIELDQARRTLWLHAQGLKVTSVTASAAGGPAQTATATVAHPTGVLRVDLATPIGPGKATLRFEWTGTWREHAAVIRGRSGGAWYVGTEFEPSDARGAFPCFDEPRFKTPFALSLVVPDGAVAVSNAPEIDSEPLADGRRRVVFARTPPLPTYLVFLAVGDYEAVDVTLPPNEVRRVPLPGRILVPRGRSGEAALAAEAVAALLPWLERWFAIPFPYEKLDHVVVPGHVAAMENAGAIAYDESLLLWSPSRPVARQREVAGTIAHEIAHQWFGDLVTPAWWTDIWLSEAFAQWMGFEAPHAWRPEWRLDLARRDDNESAKETDGRASARAIRQPLERMEDVGGQFDEMTYLKGSAVIAMLSSYAGPETFREGIRRYLLSHAHGTGSTPDLLAELSRATHLDLVGPVSSFIDRPGLPLVEVALVCDAAGARISLLQSRYAPRGGGAVPVARWKVPVCARYETGGVVFRRCSVLEGRTGEIPLPEEGCPAWIFPDAGADGYYRWSMSASDLDRIRFRGLARLDAAERIGLGRALAAAQKAGKAPYGATMDLLLALAADPDDEVAAVAMPALRDARARLLAAADQPALEALARRVYRPAFDRLGWEEVAGEPPSRSLARARLAAFLCDVARDPVVRQEAAARGRAWLGLDGAPPRDDAVAPSLLPVALGVALQEGGMPVFDAVLSAGRAPGAGLAREPIIAALAYAEAPDEASRAIGLWKDKDLSLDDRFVPAWRMTFEHRRPGPVLDALPADIDEVISGLDGDVYLAVLADLVAGSCSEEDAARAEAVLGARFELHPALRAATARSVEAIRTCAAGRAEDAPAAAQWIARQRRAAAAAASLSR